MPDHYEGLLRLRCAHTGTHALHFFLFDIPYYLSDYSGHYSHPQKLFTSNSQLQLNSEALSFLAYKPRFVSLSCFFSSFSFFISQIDSNSALNKLPALCQ